MKTTTTDSDVTEEIQTRKCPKCGKTQGIPFSVCPACGVDIASVEAPTKTANLRVGRSDRRDLVHDRRGKTTNRRTKTSQPKPSVKADPETDIEYEAMIAKIKLIALFLVAVYIAINLITAYM